MLHRANEGERRKAKPSWTQRVSGGHQGTSLYSLGLIEGLKSDPDLVVELLSPILPFSCFFSQPPSLLSLLDCPSIISPPFPGNCAQ